MDIDIKIIKPNKAVKASTKGWPNRFHEIPLKEIVCNKYSERYFKETNKLDTEAGINFSMLVAVR